MGEAISKGNIIRRGDRASMKKKLNKQLAISSLACAFPMAIGGALWSVLPERAERHLSSGGVSSWTKSFVVFGIPILFLIVHLYNCLFRKVKTYTDSSKKPENEEADLEEKESPDPVKTNVLYWSVPILCWIGFVAFVILSFVWRVSVES